MVKRIMIGVSVMLGALLLLMALGSQPAETAPQTGISFTALPGGKLDKIKPGDYFTVGYYYKVTDTTYGGDGVKIGILNPTITLGLRCNQSGFGVSQTIKMAEVQDVVFNDKINPDLLLGAPDVDAQVYGYQGLWVVPDLCGNQGSMTLDDNTGKATFTAEVQGNRPARVRFKFHLRDPQAKGFNYAIDCSDKTKNPPKKPLGKECSAPWSTEFSVYTSQFWTPTPTPTATRGNEPVPQILGLVTDASNMGVGGANITARNNTSGAQSSTASDPSGNYSLPGLVAGSYTVHIDPPAGYQVTSANDVVVNVVGIYSQNFIVALIPTPTPTTAPAIPFGVSISGNVFNDLNSSGSFAPPDVGVQGVKVQAFDANDNEVQKSTSDANGSYALFMSGLPKGLYRVHVDPATIPAGFVLVTGNDQVFNVQGFGFPFDSALQAVGSVAPAQ